ncbi:hypothetical protein Cni_G13782 [Canna indica]|uniref:SHSP domain-containing protein n=1 Tax=Canna indica TaxID=4628 RepID=A0AAQ3KBU2_9LILI|nr:hypothetical protein Cni_G13782 [Canna indica]
MVFYSCICLAFYTGCVHGIEIVSSPNLSVVSEADPKKWMELTGRVLNFLIPPEASDFEPWWNLRSTDFELERPPPHLKNVTHANLKKMLNGSGFNLPTQPSNHADRPQEIEVHPTEPSWVNEFTSVTRRASGPVIAAKTIYEDEQGYLIKVSLPFSDQQRVKVSCKKNLTHGIVKISRVSTARMPYIKRHDRTFKLTDPSLEHCPPGEFVRETSLVSQIPEDAELEAYYDKTGTILKIMVPKHSAGPEEHEVLMLI